MGPGVGTVISEHVGDCSPQVRNVAMVVSLWRGLGRI